MRGGDHNDNQPQLKIPDDPDRTMAAGPAEQETFPFATDAKQMNPVPARFAIRHRQAGLVRRRETEEKKNAQFA